ncbi:MAG: sigma 54-interacting transcriptional regulator [Myxococcales bacterium]|nr:sigma 54-interacting transcriptional regulator [Myxococcales bacterium]
MRDDPSLRGETAPARDETRASADARSWARLLVVAPRELDALALEPAAAILGRVSPGADHSLPHRTVSRRHAVIEWSVGDGRHTIRDLGSRNGSWLDGAPITATPRPLHHGAVLRLGEVVAVYERGAGPQVDAPEVSRARVPGRSSAAIALRAAIADAGPDPAPVLLLGETGTGKELCAQELHARSRRAGPLLAINCAALSPQLIESQLFGHERGAFTGATARSLGVFREAAGGTVFLDEIGELPLELQPKLLRALQQREVMPVGRARPVEVDVRVIAATNRSLRAEVEAGRFRRDLLARLQLITIELPALRQRRADIPALLAALLTRWRAERAASSSPAPTLTAAALEAVLLHPWPENLRGLDRLVHAIGRERGTLERERLPAWMSEETSSGSVEEAAEPAPARRRAPGAEALRAALEAEAWNISAVARRLDCDRRQVYRWLKDLRIERSQPE